MDIIYTLIKIIAGGAILLGGIFLAIVIISAIVSKFNKKLVDKAVDKLDNAIDYLEKMEKPSKRAKKIFQQKGFNVTAYKVDYKTAPKVKVNFINFIPSAISLYKTEIGFREILGRLYYNLLLQE